MTGSVVLQDKNGDFKNGDPADASYLSPPPPICIQEDKRTDTLLEYTGGSRENGPKKPQSSNPEQTGSRRNGIAHRENQAAAAPLPPLVLDRRRRRRRRHRCQPPTVPWLPPSLSHAVQSPPPNDCSARTFRPREAGSSPLNGGRPFAAVVLADSASSVRGLSGRGRPGGGGGGGYNPSRADPPRGH